MRLSSALGYGSYTSGRVGYCINCGTALDPEHHYCFRCGTARFKAPESIPGETAAVPAPALSPSSPIVKARQAALMEAVAPQLSMVGFLCAAGAVFWAILLTQTAAVIAAPAGRAGMDDLLAKSGVTPATRTAALVAYAVVLILICLVPMALHALAYYRLKGRRRSGWVMSVLLAGAWSFVLVGIPFLYILMKRDVRSAFGFA